MSDDEPADEVLSEDEAFEVALRDHPEYRRKLEKGTLPEEIVDKHGNVMNPMAHLRMHQVVERQLAMDQPRGIAEIERQFLKKGIGRHDVRHIIGGEIAQEMWHMMKENRPFDEQHYLRKLREAVKSYG